MTVKEAAKKVRNGIKRLQEAGHIVDRFHTDLLRDLEHWAKLHPTLPIDSPRLNDLAE